MENALCLQDKWGSENFPKWGVSVLVGPTHLDHFILEGYLENAHTPLKLKKHIGV